MMCYEHARRLYEVPAVATCDHCGVGLCLEHLAERQMHSTGGTRLDCPHTFPVPADIERWVANREERLRSVG
jgi:hypothetical protein